MDLSDDYEDCKLYTKAAENIRKKREQFTLKIEDIETNCDTTAIDLDSDLDEEIGYSASLLDSRPTCKETKLNVSSPINKTDYEPLSKRLRKPIDSSADHEHLSIRALTRLIDSSTDREPPPLRRSTRNLRSNSRPQQLNSISNPNKTVNEKTHSVSKKKKIIEKDTVPEIPKENVSLAENITSSNQSISSIVLSEDSECGPSNSSLKPARKRAKNTRSVSMTRKKRRSYRPRVSFTTSISEKDIPSSYPSVSSQNVIVLDDDSEFSNTSYAPIEFNRLMSPKTPFNPIQNIHPDSKPTLTDVIIDDVDDEPVTISIEWSNGKIFTSKQFKLRSYQKFESVFEELAKSEGLPTNRISLMRDSKVITPADTPESLNLKYYAGMTGYVSTSVIDYGRLTEQAVINTEEKNEESLTICLKLESHKTFKLTIKKHQKMSVLYKKCSEELNCKESLLKLTFDGDYVEPSDIVSSLDLEDDDIFNVYIKKE